MKFFHLTLFLSLFSFSPILWAKDSLFESICSYFITKAEAESESKSEGESKSESESKSKEDLVSFTNSLSTDELKLSTIQNEEGQISAITTEKIVKDKEKDNDNNNSDEKIKEYTPIEDLFQGTCLVESGKRCLMNLSLANQEEFDLNKGGPINISYLHDGGMRSNTYKKETFELKKDEESNKWILTQANDSQPIESFHTLPHYYASSKIINGIDELQVKTKISK